MEQTLRAYNPSWRDRLAAAMMGDGRPTAERRSFVSGLLGSAGLGSSGASVADFTPAGGLLGFQDAAQRGDAKGMAMAMLPMPARAGRFGALMSPADEVFSGVSAASAGSAPMTGKPISWYHGSDEQLDGALDLSRFGTGAFNRLGGQKSASEMGYLPAAYVTTSQRHAKQFGDNVYEFVLNADAHELSAKAHLEDWASEMGYPNAQAMIDDYYAGDAYDALNADSFFNDAARSAKDAGKSIAVVDFGDLTHGGFGLGKVGIVLDPSVLSMLPKK